MKSLPKLAVVVSVILAFFLSGASIKLQASDDAVRECVLQATRDFKIVVSPGATIEVERGQQFSGKLYPDKARINIDGVWHEVSRNNVGGCEAEVTAQKLQSDLDYYQGYSRGQQEVIQNLQIEIAKLQETVEDDKIIIQNLKQSLEQCTGTEYPSIR